MRELKLVLAGLGLVSLDVERAIEGLADRPGPATLGERRE